MKILLECFIDIESGPVFTLGLAKGLINNGVDVYAIITNSCENIVEWKSLLDSSHICILDTAPRIKEQPIKAIKEIFKIKHKFNGIIFDFYIDTFPLVMPLSILNIVRYKYTIGIDHDAIPHSSATEYGNNRVRNNIAKLDYVLILSKSFRNIVANKYNIDIERILYMRHGAMEYPKAKETYNNVMSINYLYFGRIDGYKGLHVLSKAYNLLSQDYSDISLTVAGGGDFSEYINEYSILPNCTIQNKYLTNDDITTIFEKPNTVLVLPYLDATQSGVIGMAFNYNVPVIVSDTGGLKEQLFDGEMGLFVKPGNAIDLKDKMEAFLIDSSIYDTQRKLMANGYEKSTWNYVTLELLEQLNIIISK